MKRKSRLSVIFLLFLMVSFFITGCTPYKKINNMEDDKVSPIIFRLAETMPTNHPSAQASQYFADLVNEKSNGRIKIKVYYDSELGTANEILEQVQFGGIAMARVNVLDLSEIVSSLQQYFKPQLYEDNDALMKWLDENSEKLADHCQMERMVPLVWYYPDRRLFYSDETVFSKVSDFENKKINTTLCVIMQKAMNSLGASAVETITGDIYKSLRSGYMNAGETTLSEFMVSDYYRFMNYITLSNYIICPDVMVVSSVDFTMLDMEDRGLLLECAKQSYDYQKQLIQEFQQTSIQQLRTDKQLLLEDESFSTQLKQIFMQEKRLKPSE